MTGIESKPLIILHEPYGEQHPYEPLPYERSPRDPSAGEIIILGIETSHDPSPEEVWCEWQVEGENISTRVEAVRLEVKDDREHWQAHLPSFSGGEVVKYQLIARSHLITIKTPQFKFSITKWYQATHLIDGSNKNGELNLKFATNKPDRVIALTITSDNPGTLEFDLQSSIEKNVPIKRTEDIKAEWGDVQLKVLAEPLHFVISRKSDGMTLQTAFPVQILLDADGSLKQYCIGMGSPSSEGFYGFGERFNSLDQRGCVLDNRVYGQYTNQGRRSYIPIPFFLSSRKYGVWLKTDQQAEFDLASKKKDRWQIKGIPENDSSLHIKLFLQTDPKSIIQKFTDYTGKPALPPAWTFGPWMSSNDWNSQKEVLNQLKITQKEEIPATVLVIEAWSDEINFYIWNDAQYELKPVNQSLTLKDFNFPKNGLWPDPKSMTEELHNAGLRLILWQNPTIKFGDVNEPYDERMNLMDQEYAIEHGYVVKKADGSPHRIEKHMPWFRNSLVVDFSNPEAAEWWMKKREYLVTEVGVDGFKTDGGEHVWDLDTRFFNGVSGANGINLHPIYYEEAYHKFIQKIRGNDFLLFSRAGYTGAQVHPAHWAGDENSTWEAFRATLHAMMNVGISGVPFFGWDIAGFAGPIPTSELYLRATAFSVFCPIMQYHSDVNHRREPSRDRTPWNIQKQTNDTEVITIFRDFANLRMNLLPYILTQAKISHQTGLPLVRALPLEFPTDEQCRSYPYEYLFGEALLVSPITNEGSSSLQVYLPEGKWRDFWTGDAINGPATFTVNVPRNRIAVYQREGSVIALNLDESGKLCSPVGNSIDSVDHLVLRIFPKQAMEVELVIPGMESPIHISAVMKEEKSLEIQLPAMEKPFNLEIYADKPSSVLLDNQILSSWNWDTKTGILLKLPALNRPSLLKIQ